MIYFLFPHFYVRAIWHATNITWIAVRASAKMDWLCFRYAYHHHLNKLFQDHLAGQ